MDQESTHYIALRVKLFDIKYLVNKRWVARMCAAKVKPTFRVVFMILKLIFIAFSFYLSGWGKVGVYANTRHHVRTYIVNSDLYIVIAGGELLQLAELSE